MNNLNTSSPEQLYILAQLFHLKPTDYKTANILILGIPTGSMSLMLSFANQYHTANIIILEKDLKKIELFQDNIKNLNLNNIKILNNALNFEDSQTLESLASSLGIDTFDYIICHEIYSHLNTQARTNLLKFLKNNLAPEGVMYISYDTLPGWDMLRGLREILLYHTENFEEKSEKIKQARLIFNFLLDGIGNDELAWARFLKNEMQIIAHQSDDDFYYHYLDSTHYACYFHEFISEINNHQLNYVCDSCLPMMFPGNLKEDFRATIEAMTDITEVGQYIDFVRNTRFRASVITHASQAINRQIATQDLTEFYIAYAGVYKEPIYKKALQEGRVLNFELGAPLFLSMNLTDEPSKIALKILYENNGKPVSYSDWVKHIIKASSLTEDKVTYLLNNQFNLIHLLLMGVIKLYTQSGEYPKGPANKPKTTEFIKTMAQITPYVPNVLNEVYLLNEIERKLLVFITGEKTQNQVLSEFENNLISDIQSDQLILRNKEGQVISGSDKKEIQKQVKKISHDALDILIKRSYLN